MNEVLARALEMAVKVPSPNEGVSQMEKWEYKAFHVRNMNTGADMVNALREYGEQGWELVSVNPTIDSTASASYTHVHTTNKYFVVMKRRKESYM